jgi:LuxR family maltose regulon positive regulatory protein
METATGRGTRTLQRRRIIQRPRLLALLDASNARVRMLIASAGYGKTTLAEQWVASDDRCSAWYAVRRASVDVAGLALGLARACSVIVGGCDERLRAHLKAVSASTGSSTVLAEILCEDLAEWPSNAWLVIDDYQEISGSGDAESFVADLVSGCPLQTLVTSRQRPSWVNARSILYGDVLEVGQASLAMDPQEAAQVLADWSGPATSGLVALADGWPAVIGLASVSSAEIDDDGDAPVPESLYRFFAEEVFDALGEEVRDGLTLLAVAPVLDRGLADELLGVERAEFVCDTATDIGLLVERDARLELHPLARSFLEERPVVASRPAIATCLAHYRAARDWDAAFDLVVRREVPEKLEGILEAALDDLLDTARLSTIEEWCEHAAASGVAEPIVALARAETALRHGRQARAQAYAETAARSPQLAFRAFSLAGRAAHLASREDEALALYRRAEEEAGSDTDRREARWNQVMSAIDLDPGLARRALKRLRSGVTPASPREYVKAVACTLGLDTRSGRIDLREADVAWEIVSSVSDPLVETSFELIYSNTLALAARYQNALDVATTFLDTAQRFRLDFARPHGLTPAAMAYAGLRNWHAAEGCLDEAITLARAAEDAFAERFAFATLLRCLTQQGRCTIAVALPLPDLLETAPVLRSDVLASRALALAVADRLDEAKRIVCDLTRSGEGIESVILCEVVDALIALKSDDRDAFDRLHRLTEAAFMTGALDLLVTAYRAVPQVLEVLLRDTRDTDRIHRLVHQVGDSDLLRPLGYELVDGDLRGLLTRREREVYGLLCEGLSNRQIASALVISESTAKLHVQHVYDKLGVHSRYTLAVHAALERAGQATSATSTAETESSTPDV